MAAWRSLRLRRVFANVGATWAVPVLLIQCGANHCTWRWWFWAALPLFVATQVYAAIFRCPHCRGRFQEFWLGGRWHSYKSQCDGCGIPMWTPQAARWRERRETSDTA
jgi:hypothetical protein